MCGSAVFGYDALDRVTSKIVPDGCAPIQAGACAAATRDVYYGCDLADRRLFARFDSATGTEGIANAYDALGQLTQTTTTMGGVSRTLSYQYDVAGNRTRIIHPDGQGFVFTYDSASRQQQSLNATDGGQLNVKGYDSLGRLASDFGGAVQYGYDSVDRLSSEGLLDLSGTGHGVNYGFSYNPAAQLTSETRSNDVYAWTGAVNVNRAYAVNGLNQYTSAGPAMFVYDANGNLISDGTTSYGYDAENRLITSSAGATLSYDPDGRLWQASSGAGVRQLLYDGDALVGEYDGAGNQLARYLHGFGADKPELWFNGAGLNDAHFLFADHQGSIVGLLVGNISAMQVNAYDEYGIPGAGNIGRFGYTGQAWLPELGMWYYKARIYSPTLGRFLQTDPVGYKDQIDLYSYVDNDPVNRSDPSGMYGTCNDTANCQISGLAQREAINISIRDAADKLKSSIKTVTNLRDDKAAGRPLNAAEMEAASRIDKYLGKNTSNDVKRLDSILTRARGELAAVEDKRFNQYSFTHDTQFGVTNNYGKGIKFHDPFFNGDRAYRALAIADESFHQSTGFGDSGNFGSKSLSAARAQQFPFEHLMYSHDSLNFALGF